MAKTAEICPTILATTPDQYKAFVMAYQSFAKRIQVDIVDGQFAPTRTITEDNVWWPEGWKVDVHMMVARPSEHMDILQQLKPNMVIFHAESVEDLLPHFEKLKESGIRSGLALVKTTYPGDYKDEIAAADHILIFAGDLGKQGGVADMLQLEKVELIKKLNSAAEIGWDGGANMKNIRALAHAGVDVINVGAALATADDPAQAYEEMVKETDKRGVVLG